MGDIGALVPPSGVRTVSVMHRIPSLATANIALVAGVTLISIVVLAPFGRVGAVEGQSTAPKGIEIRDLDRRAEPCEDFYAFSSGGWRASNPMPAGTERWSRRAAGRETNRRQLLTLLEELRSKQARPRGTIEQQLGDYFASCMDEPKLDALGVSPVTPLLAEISSVRDAKGVLRVIRGLHELAIPAPFAVAGASDYRDPERVITNITASGLGLPGRDYYLKPDKNFTEAREKYREHVVRVLILSGMPAAAAADPAATAHKMTFEMLKQLSTHLDWESYFTEARLPRMDVNVAEPAFVERVDRELASTPVTTWKSYLTWHVLRSASPWLSKPFSEEAFAFEDRYLAGAAAAKPRALRCLESTETLLGAALGRKYAERHFPPAAKARVQEMVSNLLAVLKDDLREVEWMSDGMRRQALAKVEGYDVRVGYPDEWTDYSGVAISRDALWANMAAARRFGVELDRKHIGRRMSRAIWQLPPSSPGAYIDIQLNLMGLPAGFLQAPAFDPAASDAVNYGAIGVGIAHDLTHAIDTLGRDFDATGQPRNWWTGPDLDAFDKASQCTVDQYEGYEIEPGVHLAGKEVLGEALGDLAGLRLSYRALARWIQRHPAPLIDGFSAEQQFFVSWGQFRGAAETLDLQRRMIKSDPHPPARYRVIGPLANSAEFQRAFECKAGSAMVRPKEQRCAAW